MQVERFFHIRPYDSTHGGATVRVVGNPEQVGQVDVQVAFCSKKDNYRKAVGRDFAAKSPLKVVPLRYLPAELARIHEKMSVKTKTNPFHQDFTFAIKYFLPKE